MAALAGPGAGAGATPVVVELFTSEGCSSCPPADRLLAQLEAKQPVPGVRIVPLSFHVDYWNRLGWTDPFSNHEFSERQDAYAHASSSSRVYTPQMIVNGSAEFVGSDESRALAAIVAAARAPHAEVRLMPEAHGDGSIGLEIHVGKGKAVEGRQPVVFLALTQGGLRSNVKSGENSGRLLEHIAVVRSLTSLGAVPVSGEAHFTRRIDPGSLRTPGSGPLHVVVFLQDPQTLRISGAGEVALNLTN